MQSTTNNEQQTTKDKRHITPHTIIQRGGAHGAVVAQPVLVVVVLEPELGAGGVLALVALKVPAARAGEVAACETAGWSI